VADRLSGVGRIVAAVATGAVIGFVGLLAVFVALGFFPRHFLRPDPAVVPSLAPLGVAPYIDIGRYTDRVKSTDPDVELLQAIADPVRLSILRQLAASPGSVCACDFTECCSVSQPTISHISRCCARPVS